MTDKLIVLFFYCRTRVLYRLFSVNSFKSFYQRIYLRKILTFVKRKSPYYRNISSTSISEQDFIDKNKLNEFFNIINTEKLDYSKCIEMALESERSRDFSPTINDVTVMLSSGTSGNRGILLTSDYERYKWAGSILGRVLPGSIFGKYKIALFLRANSNIFTATNSKNIKFNFFDMLNDFDSNLEKLEELNPDILVAPASVLKMIAKAIENNRLQINPLKVISTAEVLNDLDRIYIEKKFEKTIFQIYQCTEGFLGHSCEYGHIHLNEDLVYFEKEYISKEQGRFVPILTDYFRKTLPIIRYRLNDILIELEDKCPCGSPYMAIKKIEGREDDVFYFSATEDKSHVPVFSDFLRRAIICSSDDIEEYKVEQISLEEIIIYLRLKNESQAQSVKDEILKNIEHLGTVKKIITPKVSFEGYNFVPTIGKMKRVERKFSL